MKYENDVVLATDVKISVCEINWNIGITKRNKDVHFVEMFDF